MKSAPLPMGLALALAACAGPPPPIGLQRPSTVTASDQQQACASVRVPLTMAARRMNYWRCTGRATP